MLTGYMLQITIFFQKTKNLQNQSKLSIFIFFSSYHYIFTRFIFPIYTAVFINSYINCSLKMQENKKRICLFRNYFTHCIAMVIYYFGVRLKVGPIAISGMLLVRVIDIYCRECGSFYGPPSLIMTNGICNSVHTRDTYSDLGKQKNQTDCSIFLFIWQYIAIHVPYWHYIIATNLAF